MTFYYVYLISSIKNPTRHYTGFTENLADRLKHHNAGAVPATAPFRPWRYQTCFGFTDREKALEFERYLKTGSGREFARRHF